MTKELDRAEGYITALKERIIKLEKENGYAKAIIKSLLDNSDEYARQRARDYLEEK